MKIKTLKEKEKEHLKEVLERTHWDLEKTARLLQIPLSQVKRKIREHTLKQETANLQATKTPDRMKS